MISIIVPIFNSERTLERCLNSIKNQTYKNLEIILVNDGSEDNSLKICKRFSENDSRFIVIDQNNSGAGEARNAGIKRATGSYIGFVDSDDIILPNMYEVLKENIENNQADISIIQLSHFYGDFSHFENRHNKYQRAAVEIMSGRQALLEVLDGVKFGTHSVTKLFRKKVFEGSLFPRSSYGEDSSLIIKLFLKVNRVVFEDTVMYYYIHSNSSSTEKEFIPDMFDIIFTWQKNESDITMKFPELYSDVHSRLCWAYFSVLDLMIKSNVEKEYHETQDIVKFLKDNMRFIITKSNLTKSRKIAGLGLLIDLSFYRLFAKIMLKMRK